MDTPPASTRSHLLRRSPHDRLPVGGLVRLPGPGEGDRAADRLLATASQAAERETYGELVEALGRDALVLHAQPIADPEDGRVVGYEALVRWQHPRRGLLFPGHFIPLAEATGLIVDIDRWVVGRAVDELRRWRRRGYDGSLAVNVSVRSLEDAAFVSELLATLASSPELRGHLHLERTETAEAQRPGAVRAALSQLRRAGVKVAIDDFGAGHTCYAQLVDQGFDTLKIDRALLHDVARDPDRQAIVRSVLQLAHTLGVTVVAEGVEDETQRAWLAAEGGVLVQGYLFGKAVPMQDLSPCPADGCGEGRRALPEPTDVRKRASFAVGLAAALLIGARVLVGQASPPPQDLVAVGASSGLSEVMITDTGGHQLVGFGVVVGGQLHLKMGASGDQVALTLLAPDGTVETLQAVRREDGGLQVLLADGSQQSLATYLERRGIGLEVEDTVDATNGPPASPGNSGQASGNGQANAADHRASPSRGASQGHPTPHDSNARGH